MAREGYAFCSTTYRCAPRLEASLASLRAAGASAGVPVQWRVVDNLSDDGTWETLARWQEREPGFRAWQARCNRGKGRDLAWRDADAEFVVRVDLDTVYKPLLGELLAAHARWPGRHDAALLAGLADIYPRGVLERIGGWRHLNVAEDWEIHDRLAAAGLVRHVRTELGENWESPDRVAHERQAPRLRRAVADMRHDVIGRRDISLRERLAAPSPGGPVRRWLLWTPLRVAAWLSAAPVPKNPRRSPFPAYPRENYMQLRAGRLELAEPWGPVRGAPGQR